jgi:hypothetical protein
VRQLIHVVPEAPLFATFRVVALAFAAGWGHIAATPRSASAGVVTTREAHTPFVAPRANTVGIAVAAGDPCGADLWGIA